MGLKGEAELRALLQAAGPPTASQSAHIRTAMVRWRARAAERAALAQRLKQASAAEREAYQYLAGCLLAMQPATPVWPAFDPMDGPLPRLGKAPRNG